MVSTREEALLKEHGYTKFVSFVSKEFYWIKDKKIYVIVYKQGKPYLEEAGNLPWDIKIIECLYKIKDFDEKHLNIIAEIWSPEFIITTVIPVLLGYGGFAALARTLGFTGKVRKAFTFAQNRFAAILEKLSKEKSNKPKKQSGKSNPKQASKSETTEPARADDSEKPINHNDNFFRNMEKEKEKENSGVFEFSQIENISKQKPKEEPAVLKESKIEVEENKPNDTPQPQEEIKSLQKQTNDIKKQAPDNGTGHTLDVKSQVPVSNPDLIASEIISAERIPTEEYIDIVLEEERVKKILNPNFTPNFEKVKQYIDAESVMQGIKRGETRRVMGLNEEKGLRMCTVTLDSEGTAHSTVINVKNINRIKRKMTQEEFTRIAEGFAEKIKDVSQNRAVAWRGYFG